MELVSKERLENIMDIQLYANRIITEAEGDGVALVTLSGVDLALLVGQFKVEELLDMINIQGSYGDIVDYVTKQQKEDHEEN